LKSATASNLLVSLKDPDMVLTIFGPLDDKMPLFSTFDSKLLADERLFYDVASKTLRIQWQVIFPRAGWFQTRNLTTFQDAQGAFVETGFMERPESIFSQLTPVSMTATFDVDDIPIDDFK